MVKILWEDGQADEVPTAKNVGLHQPGFFTVESDTMITLINPDKVYSIQIIKED